VYTHPSHSYALGAGALFNIDESSEYVQTLLAKCIDDYIKQRTEAFENKEV
jgi:26S proteasome regulatory subunit N2